MVEKKSPLDRIFDVFNLVILTCVLICMIYPFIYVINYSISTPHRVTNVLLLWPQYINLDTYKVLLGDPNFLHSLGVSILRSTIGPALTLIASGMSAYALSRKDLAFGKIVRLFFVLPLYISAGLIPTYIVVYNLGLSGTFWIYVLPSAASSFFILLIKTYIEAIPESLEEAVLVDGGTEIDAYFRILLPICMPINAAVIMFAAIGQWNAFMDTQIYNAFNPTMHTLQYSLYIMISQRLYATMEQMRQNALDNRITTQTLQMAMAVVTTIPIMLVYPFIQKYFVSGILLGSIKA